MGWFNEMQRRSASPENAVRLQRVLSKIDVRDLLPQVTTPTLIFHSRERPGRAVLAGRGAGAPAFRARGSCRSKAATTSCSKASRRGRCSPRSAGSSSTATPTSCLPCRVQTARSRSLSRSAVTCSGADGARIAYAVAGEGFPLVKAPNWMTHLDHDWTSPVYGHWLREGVRANRFVRSDMRGFGRSEWEPPNFDFEHHGRRSRGGDRRGGRRADATCWASPTARRSRLLMPRGTPSGCASSCWSTVSLPDGGSRADPEEIAWRESLAGDEPAPAELPPQPARRDVHHALFPIGRPAADRLAQRAVRRRSDRCRTCSR